MSCSSALSRFLQPQALLLGRALIAGSGSEVEPSRPPEVGATLDRLPSPAAAGGECTAALTNPAMALAVLQEPHCKTDGRGGER